MLVVRLTTALIVIVVFSHGLTLSSSPHEVDGKHDDRYDHELFLGKNEAEKFEQLTEAESKRRLGLIVDKIDKDQDGRVTEAELQDWIWYVRINFVANDTERIWVFHKLEDGKLSWNAYLMKSYGYDDENHDNPHSPLYQMRNRIKVDQRRWKAADINKDNELTKTEFTYFIHPEEGSHTKDTLVQEIMETLDKDNDGYINMDEYAIDAHAHDQRSQNPQWVEMKKNEFTDNRDKNKDGKLDFEETKEWISPSDYNPASVEAKHLIHRADSDKDEMLSKEEILDHHDLFAGSQATNYGDVLNKHDEF